MLILGLLVLQRGCGLIWCNEYITIWTRTNLPILSLTRPGVGWDSPAYRNVDEWAVSFDPEDGVDLDALLSVPGAGEMSLAAARKRLVNLHRQMVKLREKLAVGYSI